MLDWHLAPGTSQVLGMDQGTFVTTTLTSLMLIHIRREQKSAFHALVTAILFCQQNSTGPSFFPERAFPLVSVMPHYTEQHTLC